MTLETTVASLFSLSPVRSPSFELPKSPGDLSNPSASNLAPIGPPTAQRKPHYPLNFQCTNHRSNTPRNYVQNQRTPSIILMNHC